MKKKIYIISILMPIFLACVISLNGQESGLNNKKSDPDFNISNSILPIDDSDLKYSRISGIKLKKNSVREIQEIVNIPDNEIVKDAEKNNDGKKGLFGFSSDTTDNLAKGGIVLLLFLIFILYRMRSKGSGNRAMRNYSK